MTLWEQCFASPAVASVHRNCSNCGAVMRLARIDPGEETGMDLVRFECECHHSRTEVVPLGARAKKRVSA